MDVLKRISELQNERGWSKYRLAREARLPESSLNNLFRLKNLPTIPTLEALCRAFGITLAQFFAEDGTAIPLTPQQSEMLDMWNTLSKEQQRALLELLRAI